VIAGGVIHDLITSGAGRVTCMEVIQTLSLMLSSRSSMRTRFCLRPERPCPLRGEDCQAGPQLPSKPKPGTKIPPTQLFIDMLRTRGT